MAPSPGPSIHPGAALPPDPPESPAAASGPTEPPARSRRGYWLPAAIAMVTLLIIGLAVGAGDLDHRAPNSLSGPDLASQISLGIQTEKRYSAPPDVSCPNTEPVRDGWTFACTESYGGVDHRVEVTEIDARGRLQWLVEPGQ
jgi:Domain of unknown function (DUF4333)